MNKRAFLIFALWVGLGASGKALGQGTAPVPYPNFGLRSGEKPPVKITRPIADDGSGPGATKEPMTAISGAGKGTFKPGAGGPKVEGKGVIRSLDPGIHFR